MPLIIFNQNPLFRFPRYFICVRDSSWFYLQWSSLRVLSWNFPRIFRQNLHFCRESREFSAAQPTWTNDHSSELETIYFTWKTTSDWVRWTRNAGFATYWCGLRSYVRETEWTNRGFSTSCVSGRFESWKWVRKRLRRQLRRLFCLGRFEWTNKSSFWMTFDGRSRKFWDWENFREIVSEFAHNFVEASYLPINGEQVDSHIGKVKAVRSLSIVNQLWVRHLILQCWVRVLKVVQKEVEEINRVFEWLLMVALKNSDPRKFQSNNVWVLELRKWLFLNSLIISQSHLSEASYLPITDRRLTVT
jgi:hypothetical protein